MTDYRKPEWAYLPNNGFPAPAVEPEQATCNHDEWEHVGGKCVGCGKTTDPTPPRPQIAWIARTLITCAQGDCTADAAGTVGLLGEDEQVALCEAHIASLRVWQTYPYSTAFEQRNEVRDA